MHAWAFGFRHPYCAQHSPLLLFLAAHSPRSVGSAQFMWLRAEMAASSTPAAKKVTPWLIVMAHRPIYCSTADFYDCALNGPTNLAPVLEPLLLQAGADLFVAGHLHNYERSWPVRNQSVLRHSYKWNGTGPYGTVHMVVGNAGDDEGMTDTWVDPQPGWSAFRTAKLGWVRLTVHSAIELVVELIDSVDGDVLDTFTIRKPAVF